MLYVQVIWLKDVSELGLLFCVLFLLISPSTFCCIGVEYVCHYILWRWNLLYLLILALLNIECFVCWWFTASFNCWCYFWVGCGIKLVSWFWVRSLRSDCFVSSFYDGDCFVFSFYDGGFLEVLVVAVIFKFDVYQICILALASGVAVILLKY